MENPLEHFDTGIGSSISRHHVEFSEAIDAIIKGVGFNMKGDQSNDTFVYTRGGKKLVVRENPDGSFRFSCVNSDDLELKLPDFDLLRRWLQQIG